MSHSTESHQARSAAIRNQVRARLAELKGVDLKSIPYPRSNVMLEEYEGEIQYLEAGQKTQGSAAIRNQVRSRIAELKGVDTKSIPYPRSNVMLEEYEDEIQYLEKEQKFQGPAAIRNQVRSRLAELKGVDTKSIPYPRSNAMLEEYEDEIQYLEGQQKLQEEIAKLAKELKVQRSNSDNDLKYEKDNGITTILQVAYELDYNNEGQNKCQKTIISDNNETTRNGQVAAKSDIKANKIKNYLVSRSDTRAIVDISYREDKEGKAAFWDHYTFQRITKYPTRVVGATDDGILLKNTIDDKTYGLPVSLSSPYKPTPPIIGLYPYSSNDFHGLLLIPGSHSESNQCPNYDVRIKNEKNLIKDAWNRGRPILGICAGASEIWRLFGGKEVKVYNHSARRMPYLTNDGRFGCNIKMHHLRISPGSILADAMYGKVVDEFVSKRPVANSVHTTAMSREIIPSNMKITAWSTQRAENAPENKTPEEGAIEATETRHGAPMLLVQWHPEAFNSNDTDGEFHRSILRYMAKAGDTYYQKQKMLLELKKRHEDGARRRAK